MMNYNRYPSWVQNALKSPYTDEERRTGRNAQGQAIRPTNPALNYVTGQSPTLAPYRPAMLPYLPSVQQYKRLNPSEQGMYHGYLEDNQVGLGLHPEDVYALMKRLSPRGYAGGPRWAGR